MHIFVKTLLAILGITFLSTALASGTTTTAPSQNAEPLLVFQVIQNQLVIEPSMIESATVVSPVNSSDTYGLQLKIKKEAADELARISAENIDKQMNIVISGVLISSPTIRNSLGAEFQLTGLTKMQAEQFIKSLELPK